MRATRVWATALAVGLWVTGGSAAVAETLASTRDYVVQRGDTLYSLARQSGTSVAELCRLNGIGPDFLIRVGQALRLPVAKGLAGGAELAAAQAYAVVLPAERAPRLEVPEAVAKPPAVVEPPAEPAPEAVAPAATGEKAGGPAAGEEPCVIPVTAEERLLLAKLVAAEAGNEPVEGQVAVAAVVVNRVRHAGFPKTVTDVIQERGQFKAVELGRVEKLVPSPETLAAVDRALRGEDPTHGALFFYNPAKSVALDFWRTRPVTVVIGGHNFAR